MNNNRGGCSVAIGAITQGLRAQKILAAAAIPTTVIKYENNSRNSKGCIYGLSFSCAQSNNVKMVLERERIRVKQWNMG